MVHVDCPKDIFLCPGTYGTTGVYYRMEWIHARAENYHIRMYIYILL